MRLFPAAIAAALLAAALASPAAVAADPPPAPTLAGALPLLRPDTARRPLLIVDAAGTPAADVGEEGESKAPAPNRRYTTAELAPLYRRRLVPSPTLDALCPEEMRVVSRPPRVAPAVSEATSHRAAVTLLLASLSPAQWRLALGQQGIGASELSGPEQEALFAAALPDAFDYEAPPGEDAAEVAAPPGSARLRVTLLATLSTVPAAAGAGPTELEPPQAPVLPDTEENAARRVVRLRPQPEPATPESQGGFPGDAPTVGVPARMKPGDLPFSLPALEATLPTVPSETLGDTLARVTRATGLRLSSEPRLKALSVTCVGARPVRAGDLLRALALATTAAYRRVEGVGGGPPTFHLCEDVRGVRPALAEYEDAMLETMAGAIAGELSVEKRVAAAVRRLSRLRWDGIANTSSLGGWAGVLPPEVAAAIQKDGEAAIPLATLDPDGARRARVAVAARQEADAGGDGAPPHRTDRVTAGLTLKVEAVVPGLTARGGRDASAEIHRLPWRRSKAQPPAETPPIRLTDLCPRDTQGRALFVRVPAGEAERNALITASRRFGFRMLFLLDDPAAPPEMLAEAAKAARAAGLRVTAVLPLLSPYAEEKGQPETRDAMAHGLTAAQWAERRQWRRALALPVFAELAARLRWGDYVRPDVPGHAERVAARAAALAQAAGDALDGFGLVGTAAPGYRLRDASGAPVELIASATLDCGYSPANRATLFARTSSDPADLSAFRGFRLVNASLLYPPGDGEDAANREWNRLRAARRDGLLAEAVAAIRRVAGERPMLVRDGEEEWNGAHEGLSWWEPAGRTGGVAAPAHMVLLQPQETGRLLDGLLREADPGGKGAVWLALSRPGLRGLLPFYELSNADGAADPPTEEERWRASLVRYAGALRRRQEVKTGGDLGGVVVDLSDTLAPAALAFLAGALAPE